MARLSAGVRKRTDGTLEKRFTVNGIRYSIYGKTNKELQEKEHETRARIESGTYKNNRNVTLDNYFKEWIDNKQADTKGNSLYTYSKIYKCHISQALGKRKIIDIERREILKLQKDLINTVAPSTCNYIITVLKIILSDAVKDEIITRNPANAIKSIKQEEKASESIHRALTEQEQMLFMQEAKEEYYYELFAFMLCTGVRVGEAGALTWQDIDYKNNVIHINKTITYTKDGKIGTGTPKSDAGKRDIPLNDTIKQILKSQKAKYGNIYPIGSSNIFLTLYGKLIRSAAVNNVINGILSRIEDKGTHIEHFTAHALRDTFATRYIEQGGSPQTLKTILGHSSLSMTMDLYAHVLPNTKQEEMQKINILI
ncbi:MAG: site-specific integrase [Lachnospiraceae bacterium]|nr:site-specific integrase [Lachnospiraceae bacterium]